jgi:hypothetical protein
MRRAHAHQVGITADPSGERAQQNIQRCPDPRERQSEPVRFDRVLDVHRGCAQVQFASADPCLRRKHANFCHEVVMDLALDLQRGLDVDTAGVSANVIEFFVADELSGGVLRFR